MMRFVRLSLAIAAISLIVACQGDRALTPDVASPSFALSDGTRVGGNPDFFFLPPIVRNPSSDPHFDAGAFNPDLLPVVNVCELSGNPSLGPVTCGAIVFGPVTAHASVADEQYAVNWHTDESNSGRGLNLNGFYRIQVFASEGGTRLGFADVDPVNSLKELKNVQTGDVFGLVDGRTLPIKFRIENAALCEGSDPCNSRTIVLSQGGSVVLEATGDRVDIPPQQSGQIVTVTVRSCDGIDVDLRVFGNCFAVTADPPLAAALFPRAVVSMCSLDPVTLGLSEAQEDLVTLHRQDDEVITALPHAPDFCNPSPIGRADELAPPRNLAEAAWRAFRRTVATVFWPRPLYARAVVLDVGQGGETDAFSDFQLALPAQMHPLEGTTDQTGAPGSPVENPPGVHLTDAHGDDVAGATVHFQVVAGDGSVTPITAVSNGAGIAQVDEWVLGEARANQARAFGRGIADPGDPGPFAPSILIPTAQQTPVSVGSGEVLFNATAGAADLIIESLTHSPVGPTDADLIDFGVTVRNVGTAPAGPFTIVVTTGNENVSLAGLDPEQSSLNPGQSVTKCCWRSHRSAGSYTQTATADFNNVIAETNEANNTLDDRYAVTAVVYTGRVTDPTGDVPEGEADFVSGTAIVEGGNLTLHVDFAPGTRASTSRASFSLDVDRNPATGFPGIRGGGGVDAEFMGVEYVVQMGSAFVGPTLRILRFDGASFVEIPNSIAISFSADAMEATVPLDLLLGNRDGTLNYKVTLSRQVSDVGFTAVLDDMTDIGLPPGTVVPPIP